MYKVRVSKIIKLICYTFDALDLRYYPDIFTD